MLIRLLTWLTAVGALVAVLVLERAPGDPVRSAGAASPGRQTTLVASWAQVGLAPLIIQPPGSDGSPDGDVQSPTRWLTAYTGTPEQTQEFARLTKALADAADRQLEAPALCHVEMAPARDSTYYAATVTHFLPVAGVYPTGHPALPELFEYFCGAPRLIRVQGAFLAVAVESGHERLEDVWQACHRGRWKRAAYVPTYALNPQADPRRAEFLRRTLAAFLPSNVHLTAHGLLLWGEDVEGNLQLLHDPRLIRLAWELGTTSPMAQAGIRRAAMCDDDPRLAEFAALEQMWTPPDEPAALDMLQWWPHTEYAKRSRDYDPQILWFDALSPEVGVREFQRLARTTADPDRLADAFFHALSAESPAMRRAGQVAFLERLPTDALAQLDDLAIPVPWNQPEIDGFYDALLERLRAEFSHGDARRAARILSEALELTDILNLGLDSRAHLRFLDLAGRLLFDEKVGLVVRQNVAAGEKAEAAWDRLRDSDPEIRRQAVVFLRNLRGPHTPLLKGLEGDPYLEDPLREVRPYRPP